MNGILHETALIWVEFLCKPVVSYQNRKLTGLRIGRGTGGQPVSQSALTYHGVQLMPLWLPFFDTCKARTHRTYQSIPIISGPIAEPFPLLEDRTVLSLSYHWALFNCKLKRLLLQQLDLDQALRRRYMDRKCRCS